MQDKPLDLERFYSLEAEAAVLGSMIIDPDCIAKVLPRLPRSDAFYLPEHQTLYEALVALFIAGKPIDAVVLRDELKRRGQLAKLVAPTDDERSSVQYIAKLMESVPSSANAVYYARIVREKETERHLWSALEQIKVALDEPGPVDERIQAVQDIALELEPLRAGPDFIEAGKLAPDVLNGMQDDQGEVIPTGFHELDSLIHGLYPGELMILAGRPSMGKSALMLDIALNLAKTDKGVLIFSLEMTERALVQRAICNLAAVDVTRIGSTEIGQSDWQELQYAKGELQKRNLVLSGVGSTPEQIGGLIHRLKQTHNIGVAFIDYIQLMSLGRKSESRQQEITAISRKLKAIALREDIPLVVLSQLNRQVDGRNDHRPRMSDLRESGSLEQDADLVLFVYREDYYRKDEPGFEPSGMAEVIVSKNRRGPVGKARLVFVHDYVKFSDLPANYVGAEQYV